MCVYSYNEREMQRFYYCKAVMFMSFIKRTLFRCLSRSFSRRVYGCTCIVVLVNRFTAAKTYTHASVVVIELLTSKFGNRESFNGLFCECACVCLYAFKLVFHLIYDTVKDSSTLCTAHTGSTNRDLYVDIK